MALVCASWPGRIWIGAAKRCASFIEVAMNFVLVHGSFHGAWCWEHLIPLLEARGHNVVAPNLPGSSVDPAPWENANLESYATRIAATIDSMPDPVILVGHSMGGIVSSQTAEWRARRLKAVVYVNGLLLLSGETLVGFLDAHRHLGVEDLVLKNMSVSADGTCAVFPRRAAIDVFYNTSRADHAEAAAARLRAQPMQIYQDPLVLTPQRFGRVRRFYIEGLQDRAASIVYQRVMTARTPCERIYTLDCDHSPFLSERAAMADILDEIATTTAAA
jgi:pimeloyl-ACP methyl ester carboxylesterase